MRGQKKHREKLIADVVKALEEIPSSRRPSLMRSEPDLYFAVVWLATWEVPARRRGRG